MFTYEHHRVFKVEHKDLARQALNMVTELKMLELQEYFFDDDLQAISDTILQIMIFECSQILLLLETECRNALFPVQSLITFSFLNRVQHVANGKTTF